MASIFRNKAIQPNHMWCDSYPIECSQNDREEVPRTLLERYAIVRTAPIRNPYHILKCCVNRVFSFVYRCNYEPISLQTIFLQDGCRNDFISMESIPFHAGIQETKERYAMQVRLFSKHFAHQVSELMQLYIFLYSHHSLPINCQEKFSGKESENSSTWT